MPRTKAQPETPQQMLDRILTEPPKPVPLPERTKAQAERHLQDDLSQVA